MISSAPKARSSVNHQDQNISAQNCIVALEGGREPRRWKQRGSGSATFMRRPPSKLVLPWHEPLPLSKAACVGGWRFMGKWCSGREFVAARDAKRRFGSVRTAIADSANGSRTRCPPVHLSPVGSKWLSFQYSWYSRMLRNTATDRRRRGAVVAHVVDRGRG